MRDTVYVVGDVVPGDKGTGVMAVSWGYVESVGGDPVYGDFSFYVGDAVYVSETVVYLVGIAFCYVDGDDFPGFSGDGFVAGVGAYVKGFADVDDGSCVGGGALQGGEFDISYFVVGFLHEFVGQEFTAAGQHFVAEGIEFGVFLFHFADEGTVGEVDAFGYGCYDGVFGFGEFVDAVVEGVHIEINFRKADDVGAAAVVTAGQGGCGSQPASVAAHDLDDHDGRDGTVVAFVVTDDFFDGGSDIFGCGTVAWGVIHDRQVVVDGFRDADEALGFIMLYGIVRQHLYGIHGIISSNI